MCNVKQFLHKVTPAVMKSSGAVIPGTEEVHTYVGIINLAIYVYIHSIVILHLIYVHLNVNS